MTETDEERGARMTAQYEADVAKRAACLAKALDMHAAVALEEAMTDLSERHWCAGWLIGLGDVLWKATQGDDVRVRFDAADLDRLRDLSAKAGGWWRFEEFVPMAEWIANPEDK